MNTGQTHYKESKILLTNQKTETMKQKIILTEIPTPTGGAQMWNKKFYTMQKTEIEELLQEEFNQYMNAGYNSFLFCRITGSVHIQKVDVKTIKDVLLTDSFGLLND